MVFSDILNQYMSELSCTAKYLSQETQISRTQISRYQNGVIIPTTNMDVVANIAKVLARVAAEKNITSITEEKIYQDLISALDDEFDHEAFRTKLNILIDVLGINLTQLASFCNYNTSTISKVRLGQRTTKQPLYMAQSISDYVVKYYKGKTDLRKIAEMIGKEESDCETVEQCNRELFAWLSGNGEEGTSMQNFLGKLDVFDMDEFLRVKKIGKVRIPTVPLQLPSRKAFTGVKGMEDGIISFLKATVLSKSSRDVIIYSDHPMDHCIDNPEFVEQWQRGLAGMVLKGIRINIIHNLDRPFHEMMIGLECWIPLQMTGLVYPYYMEHTQSGYHHLMLVSGVASMTGDAIKGYPDSGRYDFSRANSDVAHNCLRAEQLLSSAKPLVKIYRSDKKEELKKFIEEALRGVQQIKSVLTTPPIFTISEDLLTRVLSHNDVSEQEAGEIRRYIRRYREGVETFLQRGCCDQSIPLFTKQEVNEHPISLSLSGILFEKDVHYSYEEYLEHIAETRAFAEQYEHYIFEEERKEDFHNLQIHIFDNKCVIVSKGKSPVIHFVSKHPKIVEACSNMEMIITENTK